MRQEDDAGQVKDVGYQRHLVGPVPLRLVFWEVGLVMLLFSSQWKVEHAVTAEASRGVCFARTFTCHQLLLITLQ